MEKRRTTTTTVVALAGRYAAVSTIERGRTGARSSRGEASGSGLPFMEAEEQGGVGRRFRPRRERVRDEREVGDDGTDEWTQSVSGREEGEGSGSSCRHRLGWPRKGRQGKGAKASGPAVARASWASGERKRPIGPIVRKGERKERNFFSFSK